MPDAPTPLDLDAIRAVLDRGVAATGGEWFHALRDCVAEVERLRAEVATERAEVTWLRTMVGDCHCDKNPETTNGPEEDCPQHGRPVAEVWDLVKRAEAGWDHARAEVDRLCAEARLANASARPAPVWDEEAVVEAVAATLAAHDLIPQGAIVDGDSCVGCRCGEAFQGWGEATSHVAAAVPAVVREHLPVIGACARCSSPVVVPDSDPENCEQECCPSCVAALFKRREAEVKAEALREFADAHRFPSHWIMFRRDDGTGVTVSDMLREVADRLAAEGGAS